MAVFRLRGALWAILVSTTVVVSQNLSNNSSPTLKDDHPNLAPNVQRAGNNGFCSSDVECTIKDQECVSWTCTCRYPKKYSWMNRRCYEGKNLGEWCSYDEECEDKDFLSRCIGGYCKCPYLYVKGISGCQFDYGGGNNGYCTSDRDCTVEDQYCDTSERCTCRSPKKYSYKYSRCYEVKKLRERCSYDEECQEEAFLTECNGVVCECKKTWDEGYIKCQYASKLLKWTSAVIPIIAGVIFLGFCAYCIIGWIPTCRCGCSIRRFFKTRNLRGQSAPPKAVVSNKPPPFDNDKSSIQQNAFSPPPPYKEKNYQNPGMVKPHATHVHYTNRAFVNN